MQRSTVLLLALASPILGGCAVAAIGVSAALVSQEFMDNATLAFIEEDVEEVWRVTRETVERRAPDPIKVNEESRSLRANLEGAIVTAEVRMYGMEHTRLAITAKKWGLYDADEANRVITLIKRNLAR